MVQTELKLRAGSRALPHIRRNRRILTADLRGKAERGLFSFHVDQGFADVIEFTGGGSASKGDDVIAGGEF